MKAQYGGAAVTVIILVALIGVGGWLLTSGTSDDPAVDGEVVSTEMEVTNTDEPVTVTPIAHATMVLEWNDVTMYTDPVGGVEAFADQSAPDVILMSDTDPDHFDVETLEAVATEETRLYAPQAVFDGLPEGLAERTTVLNNGETLAIDAGPLRGFSLEAVAMYNPVAAGEEAYHPKGQGNGYVLEYSGYRLYLAGDTEDVPELRSQTDIDLAFVPMNLPYTMGVEAAASGTLAFAPDVVVPYHFRSPDGFSDIEEFRRLVNEENPDIEVRFLDFYPDTDEDGV